MYIVINVFHMLVANRVNSSQDKTIFTLCVTGLWGYSVLVRDGRHRRDGRSAITAVEIKTSTSTQLSSFVNGVVYLHAWPFSILIFLYLILGDLRTPIFLRVKYICCCVSRRPTWDLAVLNPTAVFVRCGRAGFSNQFICSWPCDSLYAPLSPIFWF